MDSDILKTYFGIENTARLGHFGEEHLRTAITEHQQSSIRHDAIDVPIAETPWVSEEEREVFFCRLHDAHQSEDVPGGFSLGELNGEPYPDWEPIPGGRRGRREVNIHLPLDVWYPRVLLWSQALQAMSGVLLDRTYEEEFLGFSVYN